MTDLETIQAEIDAQRRQMRAKLAELQAAYLAPGGPKERATLARMNRQEADWVQFLLNAPLAVWANRDAAQAAFAPAWHARYLEIRASDPRIVCTTHEAAAIETLVNPGVFSGPTEQGAIASFRIAVLIAEAEFDTNERAGIAAGVALLAAYAVAFRASGYEAQA